MADSVWPPHRDEISVFAVGTVLLRSRWRIARWAVAGAVLTLALVWTRPTLYRVSASFIPQGGGSTRSELASLAGQFGVSMPTSAPTLTPDFYLGLITSREILAPIARDTLVVPELGGKREAVEDLLEIDPAPPAVREDAAVKALARRITASVSKTTNVVGFSVDTNWPSVSLGIATRLIEGVNGFNERMRRDQAAAERRFIEQRLAVAGTDLRASEDRLQQFLQQNRQLGSPDLQFTRDRLQRDVSLRQQVFTTLTQAYDDARMRELRDTPVITVVDAPTLPVKSEPRRRGIRALMGLLIGAATGALLSFMSITASRARAVGDPAAAEFATAVEQMKHDTLRRFRRLRHRRSA